MNTGYTKALAYDIIKRPMHGFSFAVQGRHLLRGTVISTASMIIWFYRVITDTPRWNCNTEQL